MRRRNFLAVGGGVSAAALGGAGVWFLTGGAAPGSGASATPVQTVTDAPDVVESARPLAEAFHAHITEFYPEARIFITQQGSIVMEYQTGAESEAEVTGELHRIATEYAMVVNGGNHDPHTFTIVTSEIQAIVPRPTVEAHVSGEINEEAYLKTIEVEAIERRTDAGG